MAQPSDPQAEPPGELRSVDLLGTTISYRCLGEPQPGEPVVLLLHGIGDSSQSWLPMLAKLNEHHGGAEGDLPAVIAVDMLGHGGSSKPRTDYSLGAHANVLRDLLDRLGIDTVFLVGHSLGGGIAMQFVYQYPGRVAGLLLEATGGLGPDVFGLLRAATLPGAGTVIRALNSGPIGGVLATTARWGTGAVRAVGLQPPADAEDLARIMGSLVSPQARAAFLSTLRSVVDPAGQRVSALDKLSVAADLPVLLVWGDRDPIIPVRHARAVEALIPNARLVVFPGAGHFPHRHDPDRFAELLVQAIAVLERQSTQSFRHGEGSAR